MDETNYKEADFQKEIINTLVNKGWEKIDIKNECIDAAYFSVSLFKFLSNKYGIDQIEFNEIKNTIDSKLNSNWFENNKYAFLDVFKNGITTKKTIKESKPPYMLIDYNDKTKNFYQIAEEIYIASDSRIDIAMFINGLPLFIFELKSTFNDNATLTNAFNQLKSYLIEDNPKFATFNIAQIVSKNFNLAKIGSIGTSELQMWFNLRKSIKKTNSFFSIFSKEKISNYIKWGVLFSQSNKKKKKFILKHHQYSAILKIHDAIRNKNGGYIWHTQGSGKTITMSSLLSSFTRDDNFSSITSIIDVDRTDLSSNIMKTLRNIDNEHFSFQNIRQAKSRDDLKKYLSSRKYSGIIITTTQSFENWGKISERDDIIIISDEAHRSHSTDKIDQKSLTYLEKINKALPNSLRYGFTGTPIFETDKSTYAMFGKCLHKYTMKQAEDDEVIVPIKISIIDVFLSEKNDDKDISSLKQVKKITRKKDVIDLSKDRLDFITDNIKKKFEEEKNINKSIGIDDTFKAMIVTNSKKQGFEIYKILKNKMYQNNNSNIHFIASQANNVDKKDKDRKNFDVHQYLRSIEKNKKKWIEDFKICNSKIEILVVVDMLLTGYDVPNLRLMFIDKQIQKHNLLQTIARVNRKFTKKESGFIISFRNIKNELSEALRVYRDTTNDHSELIEISINAEEKIESIIKTINEIFEINLKNIDFNNICYQANLIKDQFKKNNKKDNEFFNKIKDIINLSTLIVKWNDITNKKIALLCKLIVQCKKMLNTSYIDITNEEFEKLLSSTQVNRTLIKEIHYQNLDDIMNANMPKTSILENIFNKLKKVIKQNEALTENEQKTLLEQLRKIINEYNENNFDAIIVDIQNFDQKIQNKNIEMSMATKLLFKVAKSIIKKELKKYTIQKINKFFEKLSDNWKSNPSAEKNAKKELRNIIQIEEQLSIIKASNIVHDGFNEMRKRDKYGL